MDRFVAYENIRRFRLLLKKELDPIERGMIERLLHDEEGKVAAHEPPEPLDPPDGAGRPQPDLRTGEDPA